MLGELTRQYQAALEERRRIREMLADAYVGTELQEALDHIEDEVAQTWRALSVEWTRQAVAL